MHYCLDRRELSEVIDYIMYNNDFDDDLGIRFAQAEDWQEPLICLSYLLSMVLEAKAKGEQDCSKVIDSIYDLSSNIYLLIQEFDIDFINYMLGHTRNKSLLLEEDLIELQTRLSGHLYDRKIRY